ncbi:MAG: uroporphyrinogen-III C-methyltransferase [Desulfarculus sp.]|nr:uroporphyrinogen-III C-methyltransferase [Desulfarculus sp.]
MSGKVYLVGAGPGDPELLTLKGARVLAEAEAVVYDFLANPELLDLAPEEARRIYVGKKGGDHTLGQEGINQLLCGLAAQGLVVVRLKGGDPFVFGRGGEEASALRAAGHAFEIVPGVTSAIAAPAYAGIPVTDRRCTTEVAFVTGHEDPGKPESTIKWGALAQLGTVVFLMGVKNLPEICRQLMAHGKPSATPAAAIRWGTTPRQETVTGTLSTLPQAVADAGLEPPAITIVGEVVGLREQLRWFDNLPLFGKRILVTRTRAQASKLSQQLARLGAAVAEVPTIALEPPEDEGPLMRAVDNVEDYDVILFTSQNGVEAFFAALDARDKDARHLGGALVGAIGPATAQALREEGLHPDLTAASFLAEGLLEALAGQNLQGSRVLIPRAEQARELLPETLTQRGALVEVVPAYRTVKPPESAQMLKQALEEGLDVVTFTASSTVVNLMALLEPEQRRRFVEMTQKGQITVASIGPITSQKARELGLAVHVQPAAYTIEALVEAIARHFAG